MTDIVPAVLPDIRSAMRDAAEYRRYLDDAWTPTRAVCVALLNQIEAMGADTLRQVIREGNQAMMTELRATRPIVDAAEGLNAVVLADQLPTPEQRAEFHELERAIGVYRDMLDADGQQL